MDLNLIYRIIILLGSVVFLIAAYLSIAVSRETEKEKYWISLAVGIMILAIHQLTILLWELHIISKDIEMNIKLISMSLASILITYALWGFYTTMRKVRKKIE